MLPAPISSPTQADHLFGAANGLLKKSHDYARSCIATWFCTIMGISSSA